VYKGRSYGRLSTLARGRTPALRQVFTDEPLYEEFVNR
jgi:hypothetical protein